MNLANLDVHFAAIAWTQLWQVTVVALGVGAVARFACRRRPHLAYLLWMLVVVKALTPPLLASPTGAFSWALRSHPIETADGVARDLVLKTPALAKDRVAESPRSPENSGQPPLEVKMDEARTIRFSPGTVLFAVWLTGIAALAGYIAVKWVRIRRRWSAEAAVPPAELEQQTRVLAERLGVYRRVRLLVSPAAATPAVFGVWRATLLLPAALVGRLPAAQLEVVLAHELLHIRRNDPAAAILQLIAQLAWWFHPLIWWTNREVRRERERACDEEVVAGLGCAASDYARALLTVLESQPKRQPTFAMPGVGMLGVTARRLEHIMRQPDRFHRRTPWTYYAVALLALLLTLPGAGLKAIAEPAPAADKKSEASPGPDIKRTPAEKPTAQSPAEQKAIDRLTKLGAAVGYAPTEKGQRRLSISFMSSSQGWKGQDSDLRLLEEVGDLGFLYVDLQHGGAAALEHIQSNNSLETLLLWHASDKNLEELTRIPKCRMLALTDSNLTPKGCQQLASLAVDVELLQIQAEQAAQENAAPSGISDEGLAELAQLRRLKSLQLFTASITDAGLKHLAGLEKLESIVLSDCPGVNGDGFAELARLDSLRALELGNVPLQAEGLKSIARLTQLESLQLHSLELDPADVEPLARLTNLRLLSASHNWSPKEGLKNMALGDAVLRVAGKLPNLGALLVGGMSSSEEGLLAVAKAAQLQTIVLSQARISDGSLAAVSGLARLRRLELDGEGRVTDEGLASLKPAARLAHLHLPANEVTDKGLLHLAGLESLVDLELRDSKITGTGLPALEGLTKLNRLSLEHSAFNDEGSRHLMAFPKLEQLDLGSTKISDEGVVRIAKLANLRELKIGFTHITDAGLDDLRNLKELRTLFVMGTGATKAGIGRFHAAMPGVDVHDGSTAWATVTDFSLAADAPEADQTPWVNVTEFSLRADAPEADDDAPAGENKAADPPPAVRRDSAPDDASAKPKPDAHKPVEERRETEAKTLARLRELGASTGESDAQQGQPQRWISLIGPWKGEDVDLALLNEIDNLGVLIIDLKQVPVEMLAPIKLRHRLAKLMLSHASDAALAKLRNLPATRGLALTDSVLSNKGCGRLSKLAGDVETISIECPRTADPNLPPPGIEDVGLAEIVHLQNLKSVSLFTAAITDAGLKQLTTLKKLEFLALADCPGVRGSGFAELAPLRAFKTLRVINVPVEGESLNAIARLSHLESLSLHPANFLPADVEPLAKLSHLRELTVQRDAPIAGGSKNAALGDAILRVAGSLPELRQLYIVGIPTSEKGIESAPKATRLEAIVLYDAHIGDRSLELLSQLSRLRRLELKGDGGIISDGGLANLSRLTQLQRLTLPGGSITDDGLTVIADLEALNELTLPSSKISGHGLSSLAKLQKLKSLSLVNSPFNDEGCRQLALFPKLEKLDLAGTKITDAGLLEVCKLVNLRELTIDRTQITDAGLARVRNLKQLQQFLVSATKVSDRGLAQLRAAMPGVNVVQVTGTFGALGTFGGGALPNSFELETKPDGDTFEPVDGTPSESK